MKRFNSRFNGVNNNRQYRGRPPFRPVGKFDPRVDNSREIYNSFTFRTVKAEYGDDNERLLRRFKRVIESSGILSEIKKREYFKSAGQKRKERHIKAIKNAKKRQAKMERMVDYDSKKVNTRPYNSNRNNSPPTPEQ
jgi:small subunit ribosomal protein S21